MDTTLWNEVTKIEQDLRLIQLAVEALQERLNKLKSHFHEQAKSKDRPTKFTDLKGILGGVNISYEEIKAAEYKVPEDLL